MFCSLNCHGVNNSIEYICSFLSNNHCDFLCLQELWLIDSDPHKLNNIHTDYTYVATSGMDSSSHFLSGRLFGGVGILFKKSLSPHIKNIVCNSKRVCGILITLTLYVCCYLFICQVIIILCLLLYQSSVIHLIVFCHYLTLLIVMLRFVVGIITCRLTRETHI